MKMSFTVTGTFFAQMSLHTPEKENEQRKLGSLAL
jgi:hypothetical protein